MNWPTFAEVEAADIEQLRLWINGLPGCDVAGQRQVIIRIAERIVATWPKRMRPLIPLEVQALADLPRPEAVPSVTAKPVRLPKASPSITEPEAEPQGSMFFLNALKS